MSRYAPVSTNESSPPATPSRRTSFHSIRSFRLTPNRRQNSVPDPDEMDAAFDGPDGEDEGESHGLLGRNRDERIPGDYDFERDYTQPPSSPPPFQPYSSHHPAPGNSNGILPTTPAYQPKPSRHFLGGILPTSFLPRSQGSSSPASRIIGAGSSGVFGNLAARPDNPQIAATNGEGPEYVPEDEQKEGPPSYQAALRDAVPPYWDTTVVLPSSSSPFGPLSSSLNGDEILIDGMASGNFFGFFWNLIVSFSFQFVGFLLTYVLHTTHAAKYGSRVGLGMTLISVGLNLRSKAEELINTGKFPSDPSDPDPPVAADDETSAENAVEAIWGPGGPWPYPVHEPNDPYGPVTILHSTQDAEVWAHNHNMTLAGFMGLPNAEDVGRANEYFSFLMMSIGWFIVLTSLGGWWRVKRFERGLRAAQRESEQAQAAALSNRENPTNGEGGTTEETFEPITTSPTRHEPSPTELTYYTSAFSQAFAGARDIQRGFFGMHGRPIRGNGHTPLNQDDTDSGDHELLDAQGFGLGGPMASDHSATGDYPGANQRERRTGVGLWGV
ncbi:uncharacterized protein IL334_004470 [Kwoniella shivajii]|uniref:Metal homeostatis protein bsd2 n=1 Tax=Kwoniella shivajii TaxID=564305 RepID=A0ABZ1D105_9TREE|nr:hypothetical protein IL334_004470 [Kwoniella shivajii]